MPAKNVQTLKPRNTVVRYRRTNGKWVNAYVTATNGAGGVCSMKVPYQKAVITSISKAATLKGTNVYDNRQ